MRGAVFFEVMARRRYSWPLAFVACFALCIAGGGYAVWRLTRLPQEAAEAWGRQTSARIRDARAAVVDLFHLRPEVRTQDGALTAGQIETTERLAMVRREREVSREVSATWWGSTKTLKLRGTYRVEAGFDLAKGLSVEVTGQEVHVSVPHAELLSVETVSTHVETLADGLWNRVQPADVDGVLAALPANAKAESADLAEAAEQALRAALQERLEPLGMRLDLRFTGEPLPAGSVAP